MTMYKIYDKGGKMVSKLTVTDKVCYEIKLMEVTGINITQIYHPIVFANKTFRYKNLYLIFPYLFVLEHCTYFNKSIRFAG